MFIKSSPTLSRFKLFRIYQKFIPNPPPISESTASVFSNSPLRLFQTNPFTSLPASDGVNESPTLPGWLKSSEDREPFYADSDDDFEIPEVSDWAQYQKSCNQAKGAAECKTVDRIQRDADEVSKVLNFRYMSPDAAAEALSKCVTISVSEDLVLKLLNRFGNDYVGAFGVFKWIKMQSGYAISEAVYNQMVDILGKCKKFEQMWELVDEMNRTGEGLVTLNTMTKVMRRLTRGGKFNKAIEAFESLESYGVKRDVESLNELLNSLVKEGSVESAAVVFSDLKNEIVPTRHTYNILIHGWCKARKLDEAYKVMKEMEEEGISSDTVTYTSFIEAYCKDKDFRKVEEMLTEMRELELRMANNSFSGVLPVEFKNFSSLRILDLEGNAFTGEIPSFLGDLKNLKTLSVGRNLFSGLVPATFSNLSSLDTLSLRLNGITGNFPEELLRLGNLITLDLSGNKFSGKILDNVGNLRQLQVLNLSSNEFTGMIPATIGNLYKLTVLDLSNQNLSGELPFELTGLPNLQVIALQENMFSGVIPEGFSSLLSLRYINLTSNAFSGNIPGTFGFLNSLQILSLSKNNISGVIPPELGNCSVLEVLQLRSNGLIGGFPVNLLRLSNLQLLDLGSNNLSGPIPEEISNLSALRVLSLDMNHLSGSIPASLSSLSSLTILDLSTNNLTGKIPQNITLLSGLKYLNLSHNSLEGEIPPVLGSNFNNPSAFAGNQNLCGMPLKKPCDSRNRRKRLIWLFVICAVGALLLSSCCCFYIYSLFRWRKKIYLGATAEKKRSSTSASSGNSGGRSSEENGGPKLVMFNTKITLAETIEATRNFDEESVLSRTRYGLVFKACYNDGTVLSIRRLQNGSLEEHMFKKEAEFLGKIKHKNLTVLRGYYAGPPDLRLIVHDYMPNGNLATLLQEASHQDGHVLNWPMRHLIALGIARGLAFLHTSSLVHGDVKPQNVLFDADFEAHLSDFGLDKLTTRASSDTSSTTPVGSLGYISPDSKLTGRATKQSDVYSFGIVLLELLTGKRPVMFTEDEDIVKWVKKQLQKGQISELLEPGLLEIDPESSEWEEFLLGVKVGLLCTAPDPPDRPTMSDVVFMLEGCRVGPDMVSSGEHTSQPSPGT